MRTIRPFGCNESYTVQKSFLSGNYIGIHQFLKASAELYKAACLNSSHTYQVSVFERSDMVGVTRVVCHYKAKRTDMTKMELPNA